MVVLVSPACAAGSFRESEQINPLGAYVLNLFLIFTKNSGTINLQASAHYKIKNDEARSVYRNFVNKHGTI